MEIFSLSSYGIIVSRSALPTEAMPFSLANGVEAVVPFEVLIPFARLAFESKHSELYDRIYDVEALKERRHNAENKWLSYQK